MKIVAMIPARAGSKRVIKKNYRLLNGKPLIQYTIDAVKASACFDEIYINTDCEILGKLSEKSGVIFYKREPELASDIATNDDFALDFIEKIAPDILIQILPTSPFITPEEISSFVEKMVLEKCDTLISVKNEQIECVFQKKAINFVKTEKTKPSQELEPVKAYACVLMGWRSSEFVKSMKEYGSAYHGGNGKVEYFSIKGYSTIDIDNEEDFQLAETVARHLSNKTVFPKEYADGLEKEHVEVDVSSILTKDGVKKNNLFSANLSVINVPSLIEGIDSTTSWSHRVINTENNSATLISQIPSEGNRLHYHPNWNEWWYIIDGSWIYEVEGKKIVVSKGDIVFIPKGKWHRIEATGDKPAIRLAVSREDVPHIYKNS